MAVQGVYRRSSRGGPFVKYGIPLLSLVVLGYASIGHLMQGRRDISQAKDDADWARSTASNASSAAIQARVKRESSVDLEHELEVLQKKVDIDAFEYKPVPKLKDAEDT
eukprot:jgi/Mesen1/9392/ME000613S08754